MAGGRRAACAVLGAMLVLGSPVSAQAPDNHALFGALRDADMRLARIGERLAIANAPICTDLEPRTGIVIHDLAQYGVTYREAARSYFGFTGPIAVEGVVKGSAADRAGVHEDDVITAIDGITIDLPQPDATTPVSTQRLVAVYQRLKDAGADARVELSVVRNGTAQTLIITPENGCATRYELVVRDGAGDLADGTIVQISAKMLETIEKDDELAGWVAHELAHNILRHRARLADAKVDRGLFESVGRNVGYIRRSEIEADMLGVWLIANAAYDIDAPARLWRWVGPKRYNGFLLARTHPRWSTRVKILEREAKAIAPLSARPVRPPILAERERPMSNDWKSLVEGL